MANASSIQQTRYRPMQSETDWRATFNIVSCAGVIFALQLVVFIGPLTPLTVIAFVPFCMILNRHRMSSAIAAVIPIALLPALALISVLWSQAPDATLRYGVLYLISVVAGGFLGAALRQDELMKGLTVGLIVVAMLSLPLGRTMFDGTSGEVAFVGLQGSKNAFGEASGLTLIVSMAAIVFFFTRREFKWLSLAAVGVIAALLGLFTAKATGALLAAVIAAFCLTCWLISIRLSPAFRNAIFVLTGTVVLLLLLLFNYWFPPLFEYVRESTGKGVGLTGRALLWREADEQIAARPLLGRGFNAFWVHGNLEAERLWRALGIGARMGFNFHNTIREILVDFGYIGLAFVSTVALGSTAVLGARALLAPTVPLVMALALIVYFAMKLPFETFGMNGMHLLSMILYTCWAMGYASLWKSRRGG